MKKERVPLTPDNREQLEGRNRIWSAAASVLVRVYLGGIGLAFAILIGVSYFGKWNDVLGFFVLLSVAVCVCQIVRILWQNILRNLDLLLNQKYRVEVPRHAFAENGGQYTVTVPGIRKPIEIPAETASRDLLLEYAPVSKTLLLVDALY